MSELNNIPTSTSSVARLLSTSLSEAEMTVEKKHWQVKKLGEIAKWGSGGTPTSSISGYYNGNIPWLIIGDLNDSYVSHSEKKITELGLKNSSAKIVKSGSVLIAMYGSIGKLGINTIPLATNQAIAFTENLYPDVYNKYLFHYLFHIRTKLHSLGKGGTQKNISQTVLKQVDIPIPPLPEQLAIVSKIEELFSELDKGVENLKMAQQQLKVYRQSLLKAAFEGRLTSTVTSTVPSTSLREQLSDRETSSLSEAETKDGELPKGWRIVELSEVADMCLGKMLDKSKNKGNYQYYLRNISVRWGSFDLDDLEQMRFEESESERFGLKKGDLVICEGGEPGRCAIWNNENSGIKIQKALHRVRVNDKLNVKFLFYCLYYFGMAGLLEKYFTGTTIKHLTGSGLKKARIPLPPISEQRQIVEILESKLTVCDKIEETISQSLLQAESLKQSILKKAFEGKLV